MILVNAADMGPRPGALRRIPPERISTLSSPTHHMPLSLVIPYVNDFCGKVPLIGVQPERTEMGRRPSKRVLRSVKELAEVILEGRVTEIPLLR